MCTLNFPGQVSPAEEAAGSVRVEAAPAAALDFCPGAPPVPVEPSGADTFLPCCRLRASLLDCRLHWLASLLHTSRRLWTGLCISDLDSVLTTEGERVPPKLESASRPPCLPFIPLQPLPLAPGSWWGWGLWGQFTLSFGLLCGAGASAFSAHSIITGGQHPPRGLRSAPCPSRTPRTPVPLQGGFERFRLCPTACFRAVLTACLSGSAPQLFLSPPLCPSLLCLSRRLCSASPEPPYSLLHAFHCW